MNDGACSKQEGPLTPLVPLSAPGVLLSVSALPQLERLLASHAFSLPVSRAEAASGGYGGGISGGTDNGLHSQEAALSVRGGSIGQGAAGYTRSGEVLGGGRNARVPGVSAQVRKRETGRRWGSASLANLSNAFALPRYIISAVEGLSARYIGQSLTKGFSIVP